MQRPAVTPIARGGFARRAFSKGDQTAPQPGRIRLSSIVTNKMLDNRAATVERIASYLANREALSIGDGSGVIGQLEDELRRVVAHKRVLTTSSGTAALHSAFLALNLPAGSEVAVGALGFHASFTPAAHAGLTPVVVDVDPLTGTMDPAALEQAIGPRTRAVVVTHLWGHPAQMEQIRQICDLRDLVLVEDCSHAYLSSLAGVPVGSWGEIAVWSMQANKTLSAGEGGFLATDDGILYERAVLAGHYRGRAATQIQSPELRIFSETGMGLKYRLHPLAAILGLGELATLKQRVERRRQVLARVNSALPATLLEPQYVGADVVMGGWFAFRPAIARHAAIDVDNLVGLAGKQGLPIHRPTPFRLDDLPLVRHPFPQVAIATTWQPRIAGDLPGVRQYMSGRLSVRVDEGAEPREVDALIDGLHVLAANLG